MNKNANGKEPTYSLAQLDFIMKHASACTAKELAEALKLPLYTVWGIGYRNGLQFRPCKKQRQSSFDPEAKLKHVVPADLMPDPAPARVKRPKAVYDNGGYLKTLETYAK
jgi:hypothetical protein